MQPRTPQFTRRGGLAAGHLVRVRSGARPGMNSRWLKIILRSAALVLLVGAAVIFLRGGLSFRSETEASADTYVIRHTVILRKSAIFPALAGVDLLASSFFVRSK